MDKQMQKIMNALTSETDYLRNISFLDETSGPMNGRAYSKFNEKQSKRQKNKRRKK